MHLVKATLKLLDLKKIQESKYIKKIIYIIFKSNT